MTSKFKIIATLPFLLASATFATEIPHTFTPDTPAKAEEVNANFQHLETKAQEAKTELEGLISANESDVSALDTKVGTNSTNISDLSSSVSDNADSITALQSRVTTVEANSNNNGQDGLKSLIRITPEGAGSNCTNGGQRIDSGLVDDDSTELDNGEIDNTAYICDPAKYTKIGSDKAELASDAPSWDCVLDNETGLMWEKKTDDNTLRDQDWTYSWYDSNSATNGGDAGEENGGSWSTSCFDSTNCDTEKFADQVNISGICGYSNWRMPARGELFQLVDMNYYPRTNTAYFPNTKAPGDIAYWSSLSLTDRIDSAWGVDFYDAGLRSDSKGSPRSYVRLVRDTQ